MASLINALEALSPDVGTCKYRVRAPKNITSIAKGGSVVVLVVLLFGMRAALLYWPDWPAFSYYNTTS